MMLRQPAAEALHRCRPLVRVIPPARRIPLELVDQPWLPAAVPCRGSPDEFLAGPG
jgi:hypothetical protein